MIQKLAPSYGKALDLLAPKIVVVVDVGYLMITSEKEIVGAIQRSSNGTVGIHL